MRTRYKALRMRASIAVRARVRRIHRAYNVSLDRQRELMRVITKALTFDDVLLVPSHSTVLPRDVSLKTRISRSIQLNVPLVSAAMDTVTEARLAIAIAQEGGIGIDSQEPCAKGAGGGSAQGEALRVGRGARSDHCPAGHDGARGEGSHRDAQDFRSAGGGGQARRRHRHQPRPAIRDAPRTAGAVDHDAARPSDHRAGRCDARGSERH